MATGQHGSAEGQLDHPTAIAACDEIFGVADTGNYRVCLFKLDGAFVRHVGERGTAAGQFVEGPRQVLTPAPHRPAASSPAASAFRLGHLDASFEAL